MSFRAEKGYGGFRVVDEDTGQVVADGLSPEDATSRIEQLEKEAAKEEGAAARTQPASDTKTASTPAPKTTTRAAPKKKP